MTLDNNDSQGVAPRDLEVKGRNNVNRRGAPEMFEPVGDHRAVPARVVLPIEGGWVARPIEA